jgi:hypothetical protein
MVRTDKASKRCHPDAQPTKHIEGGTWFKEPTSCRIDARIRIVTLIEQIVDAKKYRTFEPTMFLFPPQQQLSQVIGRVGDGIDIIHKKFPYPMDMQLPK